MTGYLAADGFVPELVAELGDVAAVHGRLVLAEGPRRPAAWTENVWLEPVKLPAASINAAAKALRSIQRDWTHYSFHLHRRAQLIVEQLPARKISPLTFPAAIPRRNVGMWMLLDERTILAARDTTCREFEFVENHTEPPSRAYLKLWELFARLGVWPRAGEQCVDLGACPGGWTWVLAGLGARVMAVDKAPLESRVAKMPGVECRQESAFGLKPWTVDWMFSDVICEPSRLLKMVERWLPVAKNLVCTLKFKGASDHVTARAFAAIPDSRLVHLRHNRHELTWFRLASELMPDGDF
jgi:23S rRNA (cytidine2498-2'-O)-methyltransferase